MASGAAPAVRDCLLRIRLRGARALSYAFRDAQYTGVAELDEGVVASQVVRSWSQGREATAREQRNTLSGPYDAPYAVKGEARPADLVWSTCAREVELSVHVALRVEPDQRRGQGYVQLTKLSALRIGAAECAR